MHFTAILCCICLRGRTISVHVLSIISSYYLLLSTITYHSYIFFHTTAVQCSPITHQKRNRSTAFVGGVSLLTNVSRPVANETEGIRVLLGSAGYVRCKQAHSLVTRNVGFIAKVAILLPLLSWCVLPRRG